MAITDIQAKSVGPELARALPRWLGFMDTPTGAWLCFVNAVQNLSAFVFYPVVVWCNDRFGRKKTIGAAATSPTIFVPGRLFTGGSAAFTSASAPILITERAYPTYRGIITALFMCGWHVGSFLAAWVTFGTHNTMGTESQERFEEARAFLVKHHAGGDEHSPLADFELQEIVNSLALEAHYRKSSSWLDMFRTRRNLHRSFISITLGVFAQWNGVSVVSYYLAPVLRSISITSVTNQTMISGFLQLWNLILSISAALNVDRFGRRRLFLVSGVGMLASYIVISGLSGSLATTDDTSIDRAIIRFLFINYGFYDIAFTPLLVSYTCEIWPYNFHARGLALGMNSTRVALFFNTFVNPIILNAIAWKYYIVYFVLLVIITIAIWFWYPETNGRTLEEMAVLFDKEKNAEKDLSDFPDIEGKSDG
ncbi:hypothetical protein BDW59DRAFT_178194 [Aspergillus cavernicola]|uniref:Major facilitator superfamily (MFS) profile domain-containing protein n=1 Tax=Aspergillus cavernicola TaxID=176166 RepID=A0ABR4ITA6_9EURO